MEAADVVGIVAIGLAAGMASGLLGIGGGVLFVPGLVLFADLSVLEAAATSLVAVVMVALVGAYRQREYGNLRLGDGLLIGILSPLGVLAGAVLANTVPERALELGFAAVQLYCAVGLVRRVAAGSGGEPARPAG